ncbi:IS66 family transposase [Mesorhizobium sp. M0904]
MAARQDWSAAIVADLFSYGKRNCLASPEKSKLAEAIRYATSRRACSNASSSTGRVEIDSKIVERASRPQQ